MAKSGIYSIVNLINDKMYIGSSTDLAQRIRFHRHELRKGVHKNTHLQRAYGKYGENNFYVIILEMCDESLLAERENHWIVRLGSVKYGYNYTDDTGNGMRGLKHSPESIEKIRQSLLARHYHFSQDAKDRIAASNRKTKAERPYVFTDADKEKTRLGKANRTEEEKARTREKRRLSALNMSAEAKKKISDSMKRKWAEKTDDQYTEHIENMRQAQLARRQKERELEY